MLATSLTNLVKKKRCSIKIGCTNFKQRFINSVDKKYNSVSHLSLDLKSLGFWLSNELQKLQNQT